MGVLVREVASGSDFLFAFLQPFSSLLWLVIFSAGFMASCAVWFTSTYGHTPDPLSHSFRNALWYCYTTMVNQGVEQALVVFYAIINPFLWNKMR